MDMLTNTSTCRPSFFPINFTIFNVLHTYIVTTTFGINLVVAFPINCYILWLSLKELNQGQIGQMFIFNAVLSEIIFSFSFFFVIPEYFFGCIDCRLPELFFGVVLFTGRPLFMSCICVERYIGVLHPLIFLKLKPMKYRIAISAVGWIIIIISCVIVTTGVIEHYNLILAQLLLFFFVKLYSCLMVLKALMRPGPGDDGKKRNGANPDKTKAFRMILILLVSLLLTYGPIFVSLALYYILDLEKFLLSWSITLTFVIMLGIIYPFLHLRIIGKLPFC